MWKKDKCEKRNQTGEGMKRVAEKGKKWKMLKKGKKWKMWKSEKCEKRKSEKRKKVKNLKREINWWGNEKISGKKGSEAKKWMKKWMWGKKVRAVRREKNTACKGEVRKWKMCQWKNIRKKEVKEDEKYDAIVVER